MARPSYREQLQQLREDAIVEVVNRLLATKGYDQMTVDEVAAEAGVAKASLYKHFTSKEELAAAAMVLVLERAIAQVQLQRQDADASPLTQLQNLVRWTLRVQLDGQMPTLPAQNSRLTSTLRGNRAYMDRLMELSELLGEWISKGQKLKQLNPQLPPEMLLYTLFARACDPVLGMLKAGGQYSDEQLIEWLTSTTFAGLAMPARLGAVKTRVRSKD